MQVHVYEAGHDVLALGVNDGVERTGDGLARNGLYLALLDDDVRLLQVNVWTDHMCVFYQRLHFSFSSFETLSSKSATFAAASGTAIDFIARDFSASSSGNCILWNM